MSYFVVGVGGTGAKLMQSLVHLSAAGLMPAAGRKLEGVLVDPDKSNGNVGACKRLAVLYESCRKLQCGDNTSLFRTPVTVEGPWTPVEDNDEATLDSFFRYTAMRANPKRSAEADLMELLFKPEERNLPIHEGFRGRPAIGAAIFGKEVSFEVEGSVWSKLKTRIEMAASNNNATVPLILAGSIFGGTGAAGVPTICRRLKTELKDTPKLRLGLMLFLPYFQYEKVKDEQMQADPSAFATAAQEALKYYYEANFLDKCDSIYAVGEDQRAEMPIAKVGGHAQQNPAHFLELVAGLGAIRFIGWGDDQGDKQLSLAARQAQNTVTWEDLPVARGEEKRQRELLQQMVLFAVFFHYVFYPEIQGGELGNKNSHYPYLRTHIHDRPSMNKEAVLKQLESVDLYVEEFLLWLLQISTPWPGFQPGLVDLSHIGVRTDQGWLLKKPSQDKVFLKEFDKTIQSLFLSVKGRDKPSLDKIVRAAAGRVTDTGVSDAGYLVRAIYDACKLTK